MPVTNALHKISDDQTLMKPLSVVYRVCFKVTFRAKIAYCLSNLDFTEVLLIGRSQISETKSWLA